MYKLNFSVPKLQELPWCLDLISRQNMLVNAGFRIAYYSEQFNDSSFRYRAYNMAVAINKYGGNRLSASYFSRADEIIFRWLAITADILVVCRSGEDEFLLELISFFRDKGKPVYFDIDDLVIDPYYSRDLAYALGQDMTKSGTLDYWHMYLSKMRSAALMCDYICTSNCYLSRISSSRLNMKSIVLPNTLNDLQLKVSNQIYEEKRINSFSRDDKLTIGYFSGSPSHARDFNVVADHLSILMHEFDHVNLLICGFIELPESLKCFSKRVQYEPFCDFLSLQTLIGKCEISIAPLLYSTFTNCKSELKFFESAVVGSLCIASPTYTYRNAIVHGTNGWICRSHEWATIMRDVVSEFKHCHRILHMRDNARSFVLQEYSPWRLFTRIVSGYDIKF